MDKKVNKMNKNDNNDYQFFTAFKEEIQELTKLSTEKLIIFIVGRSNELNIVLSPEDIVIECWTINPDKHSMRKYNQYPDSQVVKKRIGEMKGKKGLLLGSDTIGYKLTDISKVIYADVIQQINQKKVAKISDSNKANRQISSIDETPYNRLKKTSAYIKYFENRINEIVESDFLYFYGITWHSKKSFIQNRFKNIDAVVVIFSERDEVLKNVHKFLNDKYKEIKEDLI
jgi:hypothetical protein